MCVPMYVNIFEQNLILHLSYEMNANYIYLLNFDLFSKKLQ